MFWVVPCHSDLLSDFQVLVMADGWSGGIEEVPEAEWDRIGAEIAEELHRSSNIVGIHIDIEPHNPTVHKMFAAN